MGDFKSAAAILRRISRQPTFAAQREARNTALKPLVTAAKSILEANGNRETGQYIASLGTAEVNLRTTAAGPIAGKKHNSLGVLLEFGTAPHFQPQRGVMHPGSAAFPHMRPAFDQTKGLVVATLGRALIGSIVGRSV